MNTTKILEATELIMKSKYTAAFTGAGISVESGIPPFRGENGLWNKYNPDLFTIGYFASHPEESWKVQKELFYTFIRECRFNRAHEILAILEQKHLIHCVITQNVDNFHYDAGSKIVYEFHGNLKRLRCLQCDSTYRLGEINMEETIPLCSRCRGLLKPDVIFFGEGIPPDAYNGSVEAAYMAEVFLVIGTTGEVMPACHIPYLAKNNGCSIIEVNTNPSAFTNTITDVFLQGKATEVLGELASSLLGKSE